LQIVPAMTLFAAMTNGQFNLRFPSPNGQSYVVETSTNLSGWLPLATNVSSGGWFIFQDTNALAAPRFYRIRQ